MNKNKKNNSFSKKKTGGIKKTHKNSSDTSKSKGYAKKKSFSKKKPALPTFSENVRLNKFIANAGICSRREADTLIAAGVVSVNGKIVTEMGYKVKPNDVVRYDGITIKTETKNYILVNKPKDFSIRYEEDPAKKSVYHLIQNAVRENLFPVGKMDKGALGLILYTNDTDLDKKLTHSDFKVSQLFHVVLETDVLPEDLEKMTRGIFIDNKMFSADEAEFITGKPQNEIGIRIFSGKSNKVKFMLGKLGYKITRLDRVEFAGLTKLNLPRGHFRHLEEKEVAYLKML